MLCDNFFRCVVDLRHKERGYDAEAALDDLLVANFERLQKFLADLILGADRGYVKTHLWSLLARHAAGFVLIADPEFTTTGHPLIGATSRAAAKHPAAFRVPDGAMLGMGVATATTTVDVPGRDPSRVYAYAVRTQTTVTKKQKSAGGKSTGTKCCQVLRFFEHGTGQSESLRDRYIMTPKQRSLLPPATTTAFATKLRKTAAPPDLQRLERHLLDRDNIVILTTAQRTADWFEMRHFRITGTVGAVVARRGSAVHLLSSRGDPGHDAAVGLVNQQRQAQAVWRLWQRRSVVFKASLGPRSLVLPHIPQRRSA